MTSAFKNAAQILFHKGFALSCAFAVCACSTGANFSSLSSQKSTGADSTVAQTGTSTKTDTTADPDAPGPSTRPVNVAGSYLTSCYATSGAQGSSDDLSCYVDSSKWQLSGATQIQLTLSYLDGKSGSVTLVHDDAQTSARKDSLLVFKSTLSAGDAKRIASISVSASSTDLFVAKFAAETAQPLPAASASPTPDPNCAAALSGSASLPPSCIIADISASPVPSASPIPTASPTPSATCATGQMCVAVSVGIPMPSPTPTHAPTPRPTPTYFCNGSAIDSYLANPLAATQGQTSSVATVGGTSALQIKVPAVSEVYTTTVASTASTQRSQACPAAMVMNPNDRNINDDWNDQSLLNCYNLKSGYTFGSLAGNTVSGNGNYGFTCSCPVNTLPIKTMGLSYTPCNSRCVVVLPICR